MSIWDAFFILFSATATVFLPFLMCNIIRKNESTFTRYVRLRDNDAKFYINLISSPEKITYFAHANN